MRDVTRIQDARFVTRVVELKRHGQCWTVNAYEHDEPLVRETGSDMVCMDMVCMKRIVGNKALIRQGKHGADRTIARCNA